MNLKIVILFEPQKDGVVFFSVLIEAGDCAIACEGFRYYEGKIHPPTKPYKGKHYAAVICSPTFCEKLQEALIAQGFEDPELEPTSYMAAKWGQSALKRMFRNEEQALEVWARYKEKK